METILVEKISKTFRTKKKKVKAVDNISFEVKPGEIFGLLGPNGAGKTTTLRMIATLLKPDNGKIEVNGYNTLKASKEVRKRIGFLTSDMKLSGNLSPRELLHFFGELNHVPVKIVKERMEKLEKYLKMEDFVDKPVSKLSTGTKQKVIIAVSLIHDPEVIVFDEPTNGLDIIAGRVVVNFLRDFRKQGKTIVISTHIMSEAEKLCDRVGIIFSGHIVEMDSIEKIKKKLNTQNLEDAFFEIAKREGAIKNV